AQAESNPRHHKHAKHYKKYSKGWWRQYRARVRRKHALLAAKRTLRLRQLRLAEAHAAEDPSLQGKPVTKPELSKNKKADASAPAVLPSGDPAPTGWKASPSAAGELQFR